MFNKATKLLSNGKPDKAISLYKKVLADNGPIREVLINLGNAYKLTHKYALAKQCYLEALKAPTADFKFGNQMLEMPLNNLGLLEYGLGNDTAAIEYYLRALKNNPKHYDAVWNYSNAYLRQCFTNHETDPAKWALGWQMYEFRFLRDTAPVKVDERVPRWDGISRFKRIGVLAEQGQGDRIQFGRYLSLLESYGEVVVQSAPITTGLYKYDTFEDITTMGCDVSIPVCSLAGRFGFVSERWIEGPTLDLPGFKIGVVWSGSATHANNYNRSCSSHYFSALSKYGTIYSLNPADIAAKNVIKCTSKNWLETVPLVNAMDLIISVDTSIVHLAGSLGKECWMIQPLRETDFRWGLGRANTPWYKSVKIIENTGWDSTFARIEKDVQERIG